MIELEFLNFPDAPPPPPTAPYSHAVRAGDYLFVTGQLGVNPDTGELVPGGVAEEAKPVMRNLDTVLRGAGTSLARAAMAPICPVDFAAAYVTVNAISRRYFQDG